MRIRIALAATFVLVLSLLLPGSASAGHVDWGVPFCQLGKVTLRMDVYYPPSLGQTPSPAIIYVHTGGWESGTRRSGTGIRYIPYLNAAGYLVASVDYRLAPWYKFPAQIQDVKCAVRFLRAQASRFNIDPNEIGVFGPSAGGHLAALLGVTDSSAGFDVGPYLDQSSRVQAVVDMFGPVDLTKKFNPQQQAIIKQVFGTGQGLVLGSPVTYISPDDPPTLILQGVLDQQTPPAQSQEFYDLLTLANVPSTLVMVKNAGHGFTHIGSNPITPSLRQLTQMTVNFFVQYLH